MGLRKCSPTRVPQETVEYINKNLDIPQKIPNVLQNIAGIFVWQFAILELSSPAASSLFVLYSFSYEGIHRDVKIEKKKKKEGKYGSKKSNPDLSNSHLPCITYYPVYFPSFHCRRAKVRTLVPSPSEQSSPREVSHWFSRKA